MLQEDLLIDDIAKYEQRQKQFRDAKRRQRERERERRLRGAWHHERAGERLCPSLPTGPATAG